MLKKTCLLFLLLILTPYMSHAGTIDVNIKGVDDGVKTTKQQHYKKAVLFEAQYGKEIGRDGQFVAYERGVVIDTSTGLVWASKDNGEDINWKDAKRYCENYRGGGYTDWRLPTQNELAKLYKPDTKNTNPSTGKCKGNYRISKLFHITCCCPWASETRGSETAFFNLGHGIRYWYDPSSSHDSRALPVRGGN
jgi:hypothetical protein